MTRVERSAFSGTIHHMFEGAAALAPASPAVIFQDRTVSYGELNERANQLARYLVRAGVGRGSLVAIHLDRSVELIVAVLAVLKTGAGYVPVAVDQPHARIAHILQDTAAPIAIGDRAILRQHVSAARIVDLAAESEAIAQEARDNPAHDNRPDDIAFCIYTSGSTGLPKGVLVPHRGIANLQKAQVAWFGVTAADRVLQFPSFGFDAFVADLVMAFGVGAALVLRGKELGESLVDEMVRHEVTIATLPPALLTHVSMQRVSTLRCVISAGDTCVAEHAAALPPGCDFVNSYGPTEATVWATSYRVPADYPAGQPVPIGRPIDGVELYILDAELRPCAPGIVGEIHIGGDGVANGYLNQPDLTTRKFIADPSGAAGRRLYKTGDLGHYLADGNIAFDGRIDHQVKIRGFRIELGEIESVLHRYAPVLECAVLAREAQPGQKQLVAYLVPADAAVVPSVDALIAHVKKSLPDYMVPSAWGFIDAMPLNPNGKIDRDALAASAVALVTPDAAYVAPVTPTERFLCDAWAEVLSLPKVGTGVGLQSLGGSSMQAVDLGYRVNRALARNVRLPAPFGNVTIAEYAARLDALLAQADADEPLPVCAAAAQGGAVSYAQEQVSFLEQLGEAWRAYRCHASFRLRGILDRVALESAINGLIARHEILRTGFELSNGRLRRTVSPVVTIALDPVDLSDLAPDARAEALRSGIQHELDCRFDLTRPPLIRWQLFKLSQDEHLLFQSEHHHVHDGLSFRIIVRDLGELYNAARAGRAPELPAIDAQYGEFCVEEASWLQSNDFQRQLRAWAERLAPYSRNMRLFGDRRPDAAKNYKGGQVRHALSPALLGQINACAAHLGVSRYIFMLSAFGTLCAQYGDQQQFLIGSAMANRTSARYQWTVGMFVNMLPVPFDLTAATSFNQLTRAVAEGMEFALSHAGVPASEIVKHMHLSRQLQGEAPFNVGFSFHDSMKADPDFDGMVVEIEEALSNGSAKFDLSVIGILGNESSGKPLELLFEYNGNMFDAGAMETMVRHYVTMLELVVQDPCARLAHLSPMSPVERQRLLVEWNERDGADSAQQCIHTLFEQRAAHAPEAVALVADASRVTYGELNCRANRLAHYLLAAGVKRETLVLIRFDSYVDTVTAMLAVLKAGAAYVLPPPDMLAQAHELMGHASAGFALADAAGAALLAPAGIRSVDPFATPADLAGHADTDPAVPTTPDQLAYCAIVPHRPGLPLAVAVEHGNVTAAGRHAAAGGLTEKDVLLLGMAAHTPSAALDQWAALGAGAALVPLASGPAGNALAAALQLAPVTVAALPARQFTALRDLDAAATAGLRLVNIIGPAPAVETTAAIAAALPGCAVTQCIDSPEGAMTLLFCDAPARAVRTGTATGRPAGSARAYILDPHGQPVPIGVAGELYVGGDTVARGYLAAPALSGAAFVDNPFGPPGSRMFRSGERARYRSDGAIEHLGRIDDTIRVDGLLTDPRQVERTLRQLRDVHEAAVVVLRDDTGVELLAACVVPAQPSAGDALADLRRQAQTALPAHMLPAVWCSMAALPTGPDGLYDHAALVEQGLARHAAQQAEQPADESGANPELAVILEILRELMPGTVMGPHDDLFLKGMHSLAIMQFAAQCRDRLNVELKIREVYKRATAAAVADVVRRARAAA